MFDNLHKFESNIALYNQDYGNITYKDILIKSSLLKKIFKKKSLVLIITTNSIFEIIAYVATLYNNSTIRNIKAQMKLYITWAAPAGT